MRKRDKIFLCEGVSKDGKETCPIRNNIAFFCEGFDKSKTDHFAWMPYKNGKCDSFEKIDFDIQSLNITSNA